MLQLPSRTFWAWERSEDLRAVDPQTTAIAYLDQTILLGRDAVSTPRRQPLTYPSNATLITVVRIEAPPGTSLDSAQQQKAVALLLKSVQRPGIAALRVAFDATRSQCHFYAELLTDLRRQMPASGSIRHWQPLLGKHSTALKTSCKSTVRGLVRLRTPSSSGRIISNCARFRSLG
jgi:hypothetical protein